jgi:hypothetical protein
MNRGGALPESGGLRGGVARNRPDTLAGRRRDARRYRVPSPGPEARRIRHQPSQRRGNAEESVHEEDTARPSAIDEHTERKRQRGIPDGGIQRRCALPAAPLRRPQLAAPGDAPRGALRDGHPQKIERRGCPQGRRRAKREERRARGRKGSRRPLRDPPPQQQRGPEHRRQVP